MKDALRPARLLLAAKTALAVGIAWAVAPLMPGVTDQYPYYAPLGALVSMYPTLMGSARAGLQTLFGLAVGIGLALGVVLTVGPGWWSIPIIVGVAVILSGTGWFGVGRDYVPMAALFVLIIGGQDAESYSAGYLVQMGVGVVVGLAINLLLPPVLTSAAAAARVDDFQNRLAAQLREIGEAVQEPWPPERVAWADNADALRSAAEDVRLALVEGDESRKGNPRALLHRRDVTLDHERLEVLNAIAFHITDISGSLADTIWNRPGALRFDPRLATEIGGACVAMAAAIAQRRWPPDQDPEPATHHTIGEAARTLRILMAKIDADVREDGSALGPGVLVAMHLRRILYHLSPPRDRHPDQPMTGRSSG